MIAHSKPWLNSDDHRAVDAVLATAEIDHGAVVETFEDRIARFLNVRGGVAVSSGTQALVLALKGLDIREGDEIILPTYVCPNVLDAVLAVKATPVLCDVGPTWMMSVDRVIPHITLRTRAIILVHLFGIPSDSQRFSDLNVPIIEDCAQAFGARSGEQYVGSIGTVGVLSFHATKCLTTGEGGMVVSRDEALVEKMRDLHVGQRPGYTRSCVGGPMSNLQAALGVSQLDRYSEMLQRRRKIADRYFSRLQHLPIVLPHEIRDRSIFFRFPIRTLGTFEESRKIFSEKDIQVRRGVDRLLHESLDGQSGSFPQAERLFRETLSIPIYPVLEHDDVERIIQTCEKVFVTNGTRC